MQFLANLAAVLVRPRATMARILAAPSPRAVLLLFFLAALSGMFGDFDAPQLQQVIHQSGGARVAWLVAGVVVCVIVAVTALLWFYSWVPLLLGRLVFGGTGEIRGVRASLAWGLAPPIWALLYRVPAAIWLAPSANPAVRMSGGEFGFDPGRLANGCGTAAIFALLEFAVFVWCAFTMSNTLAEAHRFSAWRAFATLVLAAIAPFIIAVAAFLSMGLPR